MKELPMQVRPWGDARHQVPPAACRNQYTDGSAVKRCWRTPERHPHQVNQLKAQSRMAGLRTNRIVSCAMCRKLPALTSTATVPKPASSRNFSYQYGA